MSEKARYGWSKEDYKKQLKEIEEEKTKKQQKLKEKMIEESLTNPKEVLISTEMQEKLDKQIQESLLMIEGLNQQIHEKEESLKKIEINIINSVERLKTVKFELEQNYQWQLLMEKLAKLKKQKAKKSSQNR